MIQNIDWYMSASIYFHKCKTAGKFCKEYNYIKDEILRDKGLYEHYVSSKQDESTEQQSDE